MWYDNRANFSDLIGKTLISIFGAESGSDEVIWECSDGSKYRMFHEQDCCESVQIEDIAGDPQKLVGSPILMAEESSNSNDPVPEYADHFTWTFYRLSTIDGHIVMRWLGESNGYYSESVDFEKLI